MAKRHPLSSLLAATLVLTLGVACASTRPVKDQARDSTITSKIVAKLAADPEVNPFNIDVDTIDGHVTLRGKVEKQAARIEAWKHAANTKGVKSVMNGILIVGEDESDDGFFSDAGIAAKVKAKITADPELNPFNIDVDVQDGIVTLSGGVRSQAAVDEAGDLAEGTKGVLQVDNQLRVVEKE